MNARFRKCIQVYDQKLLTSLPKLAVIKIAKHIL